MKKTVWIIAIILVVIVVVGFAVFRQPGETTTGQITPSETTEEKARKATEETDSDGQATDRQAVTGKIVEIDITAKQFSFEPSVITVNKGDTVKLKITSIDVTHGFAINEFGINVQLLPRKTETIEFVADKTGTFSFYCSIVCGAGHSGMRGQLVVK